MAIIVPGNLKCPECREYVIEADEELYPDGVDYDTPGADESPTACSVCEPGCSCASTDDRFFTIVADWETVEADDGYSTSVDLRPVVITVAATTYTDAVEAASDLLQAHFGSSVEQLYADDIERDWWFGLNDCDPFLRVSAVFKGDPSLVNDDDDFNALR